MMTRRPGADRRQSAAVLRSSDPFKRFAFDLAWRPNDAVIGTGPDAGLIVSWPSYIGALTLAPGGTKKSAPTADAALNNQLSIASAGGVGYSAALATPTNLTLVSVGRWAAASSGLICTTVGGTVNTGCAHFYQSGAGFASRKAGLATVTDATVIATQAIVVLSEFTPAGVTHYVNAKTGATVAGAGALAGDQFRAFDISSAGVFGLVGALSLAGIKAGLLANAAERAYLLDSFGATYGRAIAA